MECEICGQKVLWEWVLIYDVPNDVYLCTKCEKERIENER